jgi:hypothetical protein
VSKIRILQPLIEFHNTFSKITYEYLYDNQKYSFTNKFLSKIDNLYAGVEGLISVFIPHCILTGARIETDIPVDQKYLDSVQNLVGVFRRWHDDNDLKLDIKAPPADSAVQIENSRNLASFTMGVDSFYTLYANLENIDSIMFVVGFDIRKKQNTLLETTLKKLKEVSEIYGKSLILCETDLKNEANHGKGFDWGNYLHGAAIFNVAYGLSNIFKSFMMPSTFKSNDDFKWGSHFFLDKHYSSSVLDIKHDGDLSRTDKVKFITNHDLRCLEYLRVCHINKNQDYNCTDCKKCLRTLCTLEILGYKDEATTFKKNVDGRDFFKLDISDEMEQGVVDDIRKLESDLK